ncbi:MAG TPA: peptide ABC transporter ATP-binding protein, partial [Proteobacteria bacterium]|nr:peptide ABC transporter ATP-binding protein [Pseudomonadota bacterium]
MESWLEARGVTFRHPRGAEGEVGVEGVDLAVGAGEVVAL